MGVTHRLLNPYISTCGQVEARIEVSKGILEWTVKRIRSPHVELEHKAYWALKHANFDLKTAGNHRKLQLNELSELRDQAYRELTNYKEEGHKKLHDSKIKIPNLQCGDHVLLFNLRLKIFSGSSSPDGPDLSQSLKIYP
ncbi:hypothetical protein Tco_1228631 [Tanacetum coccineum]